MFERGSIGGCLAARAAVDLDEYLQQQRRQRRGDGHFRVQAPLTCVSKDVDSCAWMLATNYQFVGLKLHRYVNFDLAKLVSVWLQYAINQTATHQGRELTPEGLATARSMATVGSLRDLLRRQDLGEPCAAHLITAGATSPRHSSQEAHRARSSHRVCVIARASRCLTQLLETSLCPTCSGTRDPQMSIARLFVWLPSFPSVRLHNRAPCSGDSRASSSACIGEEETS